MRAIDADILLDRIRDFENKILVKDTYFDEDKLDTIFIIKEMIEQSPTMTNIPISTKKQLLKPYLEQLNHKIMDKCDYDSYDCSNDLLVKCLDVATIINDFIVEMEDE